MKFTFFIVLLFIISTLFSCHSSRQAGKNFSENIPTSMKGYFMDDYGIQFTINDSVWTQHPNTKYHIISWDTIAQYLLARNDENNPGDTGLFTRIDYTPLANMDLFQ